MNLAIASAHVLTQQKIAKADVKAEGKADGKTVKTNWSGHPTSRCHWFFSGLWRGSSILCSAVSNFCDKSKFMNFSAHQD